MISCPEIEVVNICTPSGTHADIAERLLLSGKHVMIEKPIALSVSDAEKVCRAAQKSGKLCSVISQLRFFDSAKKIKSAVDSGALGKITFVSAYMKYYRSPEYYAAADWRGRWDTDGGLLMNQGIHGIDLLRYFVGEVEAVSAARRTLLHNIEADDTTAVILEFKNQALGIIEGTTSVYPGYDLAIEICGTKGSIRLEGNKIARWDCDAPLDASGSEVNTIGSGSAPDSISHVGHLLQIENMLDAIREENLLISDAESGKRTVYLIDAIYRAAKENKRILIN
jgi:predicted dehydrogenase